MIDTLKIISQKLQRFDQLDPLQKNQVLKDIQKFASIEKVETTEAEAICPVTKQPICSSCELKACQYWVQQEFTKNCSLNFMLAQEKEKLSVDQFSALYRKSPQRVESIYKRLFKIVQRHYLRDTLRNRGIAQFQYLAGFCSTCESRLQEEELADPALSLGEGFGYCSPECKKQHPPQYFEIERFFEAEFLRVVEVGSELFNFFYLEEILGFQPNVLRNRLEKLRDESKKGA